MAKKTKVAEKLAVKKRCNKCVQLMRNDGTETEPRWVCNNPKCVRYVPPEEAQNE